MIKNKIIFKFSVSLRNHKIYKRYLNMDDFKKSGYYIKDKHDKIANLKADLNKIEIKIGKGLTENSINIIELIKELVESKKILEKLVALNDPETPVEKLEEFKEVLNMIIVIKAINSGPVDDPNDGD